MENMVDLLDFQNNVHNIEDFSQVFYFTCGKCGALALLLIKL